MNRDRQTIDHADIATVREVLGTPRRVYATGVAVNGRALGGKARAKVIEAAMAQAVRDAAEQGVTNPDEVRALMLAYRDRARKALEGDLLGTVEVDPAPEG